MSKEATSGRKALWDELLREALARAGVTCGSLCGPEAPLHVAVVDPTNNGAYWVARGAEEQKIRVPRPSADEPAFIAYATVEDVHLGVAQRLEWPDAVRRGQGRREPASLVAHAVAKANRMGVISISRGRFGGHLVKLR